jgi:dihydrodipicolinate synthase/N-acetylneuraminate lyase
MMNAQDFRGLYAIIATPAKPGSDRLDAIDTVDLPETERLVNKLIDDGSSGLIVLGTTGECATLSEMDFRNFTGCVAETVKGRIPTFIGATALGGHEVARRLKHVTDLGVEGSLLGLPMWQPLTTQMAVHYYTQVAETFPDLAIMVYANVRAFRFSFPVEFWAEIAKSAPTVTSAKVSRATGLVEQIAATGGRINFMPSDMVVDQFLRLSPQTTTAAWATAAGMDPAPCVALMRAIAIGDGATTKDLVAAIAWANEPITPLVSNPELFASYNIQMEKTRINAAGYSSCGPTRPPYQDFPENHAADARTCAARWRQVCHALKSGDAKERPWRAAA